MAVDAYATEPGLRLGLPLCRQYVLMRLGSLPIRVADGVGSRRCVVRFACGWIVGCQRELLGVWLESSADAQAGNEVARDLEARGVECIKYIQCTDDTEACRQLLEAFPRALALPPLGDSIALATALQALPQRIRGLVHCADELVHRVRQSLQRAVDRKGCFEDEASVVAFVSAELEHIDRRSGGAGALPGRRRRVRDSGCRPATAWGH